jgi:hypothetical protein
VQRRDKNGTAIPTLEILLSPGMNSDSGVVPRASAITLTLPKKRRPVLYTADRAHVRSRWP